MKKPPVASRFHNFLFLYAHIFLLLSFCISCVYHPIESSEEPDAGISPKTIKDKIQKEITALPPYKLYHYIPLVEAWENINFKSFDYLSFFQKACSLENQIKNSFLYECVFPNKNTQLSIINKETIIITFKDFEVATAEGVKIINGVWEITGTVNNFIVSKYERSCINTNCILKIVDYTYKTERTDVSFNASVEIGSSSGRYWFYFNDLHYGICANKPVGRIYFQAGGNKAEAIFFEDTKCNSCIPIVLNETQLKFNLCHDWKMKDLFEEF